VPATREDGLAESTWKGRPAKAQGDDYREERTIAARLSRRPAVSRSMSGKGTSIRSDW